MILNAILFILQGILSLLLAPLSILNIGIEFVVTIPIISNFIGVVAFVLPWEHLTPLITVVIGIFLFRASFSVIKTIWHFIPIVGN